MIHAYSLGRARRFFPNQLAIRGGEVRSTFRDLHERVQRTVAALTGRGLGPGDRLAILLPNEREYLELVYACAWLGVIAVPLNTRLAPVEIDRILGDANPRGLIRHSSLPTGSAGLPWQIALDEEPLNLGDGAVPEPIYDPDAVLTLIYTSGTTGHPKGVAQTHANILANIEHWNYWMPHKKDAVHLHAAPLFHIADFPVMFAAPAFGGCQVTIPKFSAQHFCEAVESERVTHTVLVPAMLNLLTEFAPLKDYDLTSLEEVAYGGSPMAPELIRRTRVSLPGLRLVQGYGLSETGFLTALQDEEHSGRTIASCGRPSPGIDVQVVDASGKQVCAGETGELVARGANVMRGYWNNAAASAAAFRDGFLHTGDIGYQDGDGYFYVLDRAKDMIVTGGENVYSGEVEAVIYEHPSVREAAVFGIPDEKWGEIVMAEIVLKPGKTLTADGLIAHCRRSLANYKIPRRVEFSSIELPKSASGKILKRALRERFWVHEDRSVG
ncbi:MAG TPA: AMP-binding protein [Stellaceae bacterium]|jgi:long-chain acyl-CoA synthetase